jgi:HAD superfamily hydrolase (TIGR01459 family)
VAPVHFGQSRLRTARPFLPDELFMTPPQNLAGLSFIARDYDAVFCDIWGVIHNGREHFPAAVDALKRFKAEVGPVILISNSPRPREGLISQLAELGVYDDAFDFVVSSGDATHLYLKELAPSGPAFIIGPPRDTGLYAGIDIDKSGTPDTASFISCTGLFDDENDTLEMYHAPLKACAERKVPMICANPDRVVQRGDRIIYCAGTLADIYMAMGGEVIMAGKPYAPIYELCYKALTSISGKPADRARILAIGDGLPTDVLGANSEGLDLIFIAAGIHAEEAKGKDGELDAALLQAVLAHAGAHARYVAPTLVW